MTPSCRVAMYVTPVAFVSVCLNIPKFMETQANITDNSTEIGVTEMRLNPTYMLYYTISQIFHPTLTTGILPMGALIFMNFSIFMGEFVKNLYCKKEILNQIAHLQHTFSQRGGASEYIFSPRKKVQKQLVFRYGSLSSYFCEREVAELICIDQYRPLQKRP